MSEQDEAREALESIAATRRETADRAASPSGYYALAGFGMAVVTVGIGLEDAWRWGLYALGLAIVLGAMVWYSRHTGIVTFATLREPGAWRAWSMIVVSIVGLLVAALFGVVPAIVAAVVTFACWSILGPTWDADWQRSLEQQR